MYVIICSCSIFLSAFCHAVLLNLFIASTLDCLRAEEMTLIAGGVEEAVGSQELLTRYDVKLATSRAPFRTPNHTKGSRKGLTQGAHAGHSVATRATAFEWGLL